MLHLKLILSSQLIDKYAFKSTWIRIFVLPEYTSEIREGAFESCKNLIIFKINANSELKTINSDFIY